MTNIIETPIILAASSYEKQGDIVHEVGANSGAEAYHAQTSWFTTENVVAASLVVFLLLVFIKARKSIVSALDARGENVRAQLKEAQMLKEEAENLLADVKRQRDQAEQDAAAILASAKREAEQARERAKSDLKLSLARRETAAAERITRAELSALEEVKVHALTLARHAATLILAETMQGPAGERAIDSSIKTLQARLN